MFNILERVYLTRNKDQYQKNNLVILVQKITYKSRVFEFLPGTMEPSFLFISIRWVQIAPQTTLLIIQSPQIQDEILISVTYKNTYTNNHTQLTLLLSPYHNHKPCLFGTLQNSQRHPIQLQKHHLFTTNLPFPYRNLKCTNKQFFLYLIFIIMRSNSQAPKKQIIRQPVTDKSITSTRPQTRRTSLQPQMRKTTTKVGEPHLRPKKCPNCGSSFSPSQYNNHFKYCFRVREEQKKNKNMSETMKQSFRIKKLKGKKEETVDNKQMIPELQNQTLKQYHGLKKQSEKVEEKQEFQIENPQFEKKRENVEPIIDENGNEINNIEEIQEIRDIIQEEETGRRPVRIVEQRQPPEPQTQLVIQNQHHRQTLSSDSSDSSIIISWHQAPAHAQPIPHNHPQQSQNHNDVQNIIQGVNISEIIALVTRLDFLRENPIVRQKLRSLTSFIQTINLMVQSGGIPTSSISTIKNVLQYLVGELTQILTIIVSARMGMVLLLIPSAEPYHQSQGFTQQQIDSKFPPQIHQSHNQTCTVCLNDFVKYERTMTLKCKHEFHISCISEWLLKRVNCPVCRADQK